MARPERPITRINSAYEKNQHVNAERMQKKKKRLIQRLVVFGMAFALLFGVMITFHVKQRSMEADLKTEYKELNEELTGLQNQEGNLKEEIDLLNDKEYILDIARTNYFLSKEGELIFQTDDPDERTY